MSANGAYERCEVTYYRGGESVWVGEHSGAVAGTLTGAELPSSATCCISWRITAASYRGGHGRTYLPTPTVNQMGTVNQWTLTYKNAVANSAVAFLLDCDSLGVHSAGDFNLCVLRRYRNKEVLDPPELHNIVSASADQRIDTQRRRLGKQ